MRFLSLLSIPFLFLALAGCDSVDSNNDEGLLLRIGNNTGEIISVVVIGDETIDQDSRLTANFGNVAVGGLTGYMEVNELFVVQVNGEVFDGGTGSFGIDYTPSNGWTFTVNSLNGGWILQADFD